MQLQCRYSSAALILWVLRGRVNARGVCRFGAGVAILVQIYTMRLDAW